MKTFMAKKEEVEMKWYVLDLEGKVLGRAASQVADVLRGKSKPTFTPHVDTGDYVVVINAEKVKVTGKKKEDKVYYRHSNYPGGLKSATLAERLEKKPEGVFYDAVKGMLPKNKLGRQILTKLKVYTGGEHPHGGQTPQALEL